MIKLRIENFSAKSKHALEYKKYTTKESTKNRNISIFVKSSRRLSPSYFTYTVSLIFKKDGIPLRPTVNR